MILKYYYWSFISAIPPDVCDQIIEIGLNRMADQEEQFGKDITNATVGGWKQKNEGNTIPVQDCTVSGLQKKKIDPASVYVRDSNVTFLDDPALYQLIWPFIHKANENAGWNFDWDYTENFQFTKYSKEQFYGWHTDSNENTYEEFDPKLHAIHKNQDGSPMLDMSGAEMPEEFHRTTNSHMIGKIRKLSVTVSLNDPADYSGGTLRFDLGPHRPDRYHLCKEIRPKGSIVVFPSHIHHQVTPVTKGTRYSLVCWNLGKPWK